MPGQLYKAGRKPLNRQQIACFSLYKGGFSHCNGRNRQFGGILLATWWHPGGILVRMNLILCTKKGGTYFWELIKQLSGALI